MRPRDARSVLLALLAVGLLLPVGPLGGAGGGNVFPMGAGDRGATGAGGPSGSPASLPSTLGHVPEGPVAASAFRWTNLSLNASGGGPGPRSRAASAFDEAHGRIVVFGGLGPNGYPLGDTWTYQNGSWTNWTGSLARAPAPRSGAAMTYDPTVPGVVLFGGSGFTGPYFNDTWTFTAAGWTNVSAGAGRPPPAAYGAALAYDSSDGLALLFGGASPPGVSGSTWGWSGGGWTNRTPAGPSPAARLDLQMADDPADHGVLLFGGYDGNATFFDDTWLFRAGSWSNLTAPGGPTPPTVESGALLPAGNASELLLVMGSFVPPDLVPVLDPYTWGWVRGAWTNETGRVGGMPPLRDLAATASASAEGVGYLLGGDGAGGPLADLEALHAPCSLGASANTSVSLAGLPVAFRASPGGGVPPWGVLWRFGDGGSATNLTPVHRFGAAGTYHVTVWANDSAGGQASATLTIAVVQGMGVSASAAPSLLDAGDRTNLSATVVGGVAPFTYLWDFGDGSPSATLPTLAHLYGAPGSYVATVTVTDASGRSAQGNATVTVAPRPQLALTASPAVAPPGATVAFTSQITDGTAPFDVTWSFGDGTGAATLSAGHAYARVGTYNVVANLTDAVGTPATASLVMTVTATGTSLVAFANLSSAPGTIFPVGTAVGLLGSARGGTPPYTFTWDLGDGATSPGRNASHPYLAPGTYRANLTVRDAAGEQRYAGVQVLVVAASGGPSPPSGPAGWVDPGTATGRVVLGVAAAAVVLGVVAGLWAARRRRPKGSEDAPQRAGRSEEDPGTVSRAEAPEAGGAPER